MMWREWRIKLVHMKMECEMKVFNQPTNRQQSEILLKQIFWNLYHHFNLHSMSLGNILWLLSLVWNCVSSSSNLQQFLKREKILRRLSGNDESLWCINECSFHLRCLFVPRFSFSDDISLHWLAFLKAFSYHSSSITHSVTQPIQPSDL